MITLIFKTFKKPITSVEASLLLQIGGLCKQVVVVMFH